jgi:hypothetical protein
VTTRPRRLIRNRVVIGLRENSNIRANHHVREIALFCVSRHLERSGGAGMRQPVDTWSAYTPNPSPDVCREVRRTVELGYRGGERQRSGPAARSWPP